MGIDCGPSLFGDFTENQIEDICDSLALPKVALGHMSQGLVVVDASGRIRLSNRRAVELLDLPSDKMKVGPSYPEILWIQWKSGEYGPNGEYVDPQVLTMIKAAKAGTDLFGNVTFYERTRPNGIALEVRTVPLPDGGFVRTYTDITDRKRSQCARTLAATFDALGLAAIALDRAGRVVAISAAADELLRTSRVLRLDRGRLTAAAPVAARDLDRAVALCTLDIDPGLTSTALVLRAGDGTRTMLRVTRLPHERVDLGAAARSIVVIEAVCDARPPLAFSSRPTVTEREIGRALLDGMRPADIAQRRGVSIHTVRSQIKTLFAKAGANGFIEFAAKVRAGLPLDDPS